jgi:hypothetical protein
MIQGRFLYSKNASLRGVGPKRNCKTNNCWPCYNAATTESELGQLAGKEADEASVGESVSTEIADASDVGISVILLALR